MYGEAYGHPLRLLLNAVIICVVFEAEPSLREPIDCLAHAIFGSV